MVTIVKGIEAILWYFLPTMIDEIRHNRKKRQALESKVMDLTEKIEKLEDKK